MNDDKYETVECQHCGGESLCDVTHTGEVHCPHCRRRIKVQLGRSI